MSQGNIYSFYSAYSAIAVYVNKVIFQPLNAFISKVYITTIAALMVQAAAGALQEYGDDDDDTKKREDIFNSSCSRGSSASIRMDFCGQVSSPVVSAYTYLVKNREGIKVWRSKIKSDNKGRLNVPLFDAYSLTHTHM